MLLFQSRDSKRYLWSCAKNVFAWTSGNQRFNSNCEMGKSQSFHFFKEQNSLLPFTKHSSPEGSETFLLSWFLFEVNKRNDIRDTIGNLNLFFSILEKCRQAGTYILKANSNSSSSEVNCLPEHNTSKKILENELKHE